MVGLRVAVLGLGTMGQAIVRGLVMAGEVDPSGVHVHDHGPTKREVATDLGLTWHDDAADAVAAADYVVVATKPKDVAEVLGLVAGGLDGKVVVSIVGGLPVEDLHSMVSDTVPVVRVLPNTPIAHRAGMSVLSRDDRVSQEQVDDITALFAQLGEVVELPEQLMDAATAVAGCGPAFVYQMIEGLADGAVAMGLPRATAYHLAAQMVRGAATTVLASGEHPGRLKDAVTTPSGSTIRGVLALEQRAVRSAFSHAVIDATNASAGK